MCAEHATGVRLHASTLAFTLEAEHASSLNVGLELIGKTNKSGLLRRHSAVGAGHFCAGCKLAEQWTGVRHTMRNKPDACTRSPQIQRARPVTFGLHFERALQPSSKIVQ